MERQVLAADKLRIVNDLLQAEGPLLMIGPGVDATIISALNTTKNQGGVRDTDIKQTRKGNNRYFG